MHLFHDNVPSCRDIIVISGVARGEPVQAALDLAAAFSGLG